MILSQFFSRITVFIILIRSALIYGCESKADKARDKYVEATHTRLLKIEHEILALRERADNWGTQDTSGFKAQIEHLSDMEIRARKQLETLKNTEEESWQTARAEMEKRMQAAEKAYQNTRDW